MRLAMSIVILAFIMLALVTFPGVVEAQTTSVSGTITDLGGVIWKNGTYSFFFVPSPGNPAGPYRQSGSAFNTGQVISGNLDGTGSLTSVAVPDNLTITPSGSTWRVQVCPAATATNGCFATNLAITGASQSITATVVPPAVIVNMSNPPNNPAAYVDAEIVSARQGNTYFNLTDSTIHICSLPVCTWISLPTSGGLNTWTQLQTFNAGLTSAGPNTLNGGGTRAGAWTNSGAEAFTNSLTAGKSNNVFAPDGTQYATCQAAINALPVAGTIGGFIAVPPRTCKLSDFYGLVQDNGVTLSTIGAGSYIQLLDWSGYFKSDDPGTNNGYSYGPKLWMFGSEVAGAGAGGEFEILAQRHPAYITNLISGASRLVDPTTGCVGNGASTTCTIKVGQPNIVWGTSNVCLNGFVAGSTLNSCFTLTSSTTTTFTFASPFNGTALGTASTFAVSNVGTAGTTREGFGVLRIDGLTLWESGAGLSGTNSNNMGWSLQNYTLNQGGTTMFAIHPVTGTATFNSGTQDSTLAMELYPRSPNVAPIFKLQGPASEIRMTDPGNNGVQISFQDAGVTDAVISWTGSGGSPASVMRIGSNISGGKTVIRSGGFVDAATFDSTQNMTLVGAFKMPNVLISPTAPTIAAAGCGGGAASIVVSNGTAAFKINVGTTPGSACTITMPTATTGWNCFATDITTNSTSVFLQKQTGAESTTSVTITNFSDVAAATAFVANDILKVSCHAD